MESHLRILRGVPRQSDREYEFFRQRLVDARQQARLTQSEVADRIGKPQSYVSKCESGERRVDVIELAELAAIYDRPLSWFVPA